jgi:DNA-binding CsgD family transcriptional regulator
MGTVGRVMVGTAGEVVTLADLGGELSRQLGRLIPHEGYVLRGVDPVSGAGCFVVSENGYSGQASKRLELNEARDVHSLASLAAGPSPVGILGSGGAHERHSERLHEIMRDEGFGSEMRIALLLRDLAWGGIALLRARGSRPFSARDAAHAQRMPGVLAAAVKQFVAAKPLRAVRSALTPGIVMAGPGDTILGASPTARDWLTGLLPAGARGSDEELFANIWNIVHLARRTGAEAISRIPTSRGWVALRAQPIDGGDPGGVAVTIGGATGGVLVPALAAWYGITPRERAVIGHAIDGAAAKQIATRLGVTQHTVHDHFKAIYRKTGVSSRDQLLASLC